MREPELMFGYPKNITSVSMYNTSSENPFYTANKNGTAWSCARRLNPNYGGPLIRVRRTYDNAEQDIYCDSGGNLDENSLINFITTDFNFFAQSESLNTSPWGKSNVTVTENALANPIDGNITACLIRDNNTTGAHYVEQGTGNNTIIGPLPVRNYNNNTTEYFYTLRFYIKSNTSTFANWYMIYTPGFAFCYRYLNFTTGVVTKMNINWGAPNTITVNTLANGWYEIIETFTLPQATIDSFTFRFYTSTTGTNYLSYTGTSSESFYVWGLQINPGKTPTTYVKTTSNISGNAHVTKLYDQFNGRDAVQSIANRQPRIVYGGKILKLNNKPSMFNISSNLNITFSFSAGTILRNVESVSFFSVAWGNQGGYNQQPIIVIYGNTTSTIRFAVGLESPGFVNMITRFTRLDGGSSVAITGSPRQAFMTLLFSSIVDYTSSSGIYNVSTVQKGVRYGVTGGRTSDTNSTTSYIGTYNLAANWDNWITEIIIIPENVSHLRTMMEKNICDYYAIEKNT